MVFDTALILNRLRCAAQLGELIRESERAEEAKKNRAVDRSRRDERERNEAGDFED